MIDILDPNGTRLSSEVLGDKSVSTIQPRDEIKAKFNNSIVKADQYFYNDNLPEARANYTIANVIDDEEAYPQQQLKLIEKDMEDKTFDAFLATVEEVDDSEFIIPEDPAMADNSQMIIPAETPVEEIAVVEEAEPQRDVFSLFL